MKIKIMMLVALVMTILPLTTCGIINLDNATIDRAAKFFLTVDTYLLDDDEIVEDIILRDNDGNGCVYKYTYNGEEYTAAYANEDWKLYNSYKITSEAAMRAILQALIDEHPIHNRDYSGYRTMNDMVYEWKLHNLCYYVLRDDDLKEKARNVDINASDQGLTLTELYRKNTGKVFDLADFIEDELSLE